MNTRILLIVAAVAGALAIGAAFRLWMLYDDGGAGSAGSTAAVDIGGDFTLVDHNGVTRSDEDFRGKLLLVYFGFNYCPDVCPTTLSRMTRALDALGDEAASVQPLYITVDPERDDVASMKAYVSNFHPSLIGLTGTPEQIAKAAKAYRVYYKKVGDDPDTYLMDHSAFIFLMGRDGGLIRHFSHEATADDIAAAIESALAAGA